MMLGGAAMIRFNRLQDAIDHVNLGLFPAYTRENSVHHAIVFRPLDADVQTA